MKKEIKNKTCVICGNEFRPRYSTAERTCSFGCAKHYKAQKDAEKTKPQKPSKARQVSESLLRRTPIYNIRKKAYLKENTICEVKGCCNPSTHIHHRAGRNGILLIVVRYFMAVCNGCHPKKIHNNPNWSRGNGYIVTVDATKLNGDEI